MGGCMDAPKDKKASKINAPGQPKVHDSTKPTPSRVLVQEQLAKSIEKAKYKQMSLDELLYTYRIEHTLQHCSKLEGPKYLCNVVDGSSKVLRVVNLTEIIDLRLDAYQEVLNLQIFENDEGSLTILDDYCSGEDLYELTDKYKDGNHKEPSTLTLLQKVLTDAFTTIAQFHKRKVWLGNLTLSSFRRVSPFESTFRLVDFNLTGHVTDLEMMGFAHRENFEADWQFLGYLLQFMMAQQPPLFIAHKMQYVLYEAIPHSDLILELLKGRKCSVAELGRIPKELFIINEKVSLGYRLRRDINKLLRMRKKRKAHNRRFYGQDTNTLISAAKFSQEGLYRLEADRIFERMNGYLHRVRTIHEESFLNYSTNGDGLRRLKEVFLLSQTDKKMVELKDILSTIK